MCGDTTDWLLTAGGIAGNELCVFGIEESKISPQKEACHVFKTPIHQITASLKQLDHTVSRLVGVRTFTGISFLSAGGTNANDASPSSPLLFHEIHEAIHHTAEPLHLAFNPTIPCEAAWICSDRSIHVWDLLSAPVNPHQRTRTIKNGGDSAEIETQLFSNQSLLYRHNSYKWKGLEYAWHPRILFIGEAKTVSLLDLRSPVETLLPFYTPSPSSSFSSSSSPVNYFLRGIATNPLNSFELGICGTESTSLLDTRYPKSPVMEWAINDPDDGPEGITFFKSGNESALVTWNRRHGDISVFPFSSYESKNNPGLIHSFVGDPNIDENHHQQTQTHQNTTTTTATTTQSKYKPQRLSPFHHHDALYASPFGDKTFSVSKKRIDLYHPEEPSWNYVPDVPHPLFKKRKEDGGGGGGGGAATTAADGVGDVSSSSEMEAEWRPTGFSRETRSGNSRIGAVGSSSAATGSGAGGGSAGSSGVVGGGIGALGEPAETRRGKEDLRREWDKSVPPWPGLAGLALRDSGNGRVDLFQASFDGAVYRQTLSVSGGERDEPSVNDSVDTVMTEEEADQDDGWTRIVEQQALEEYERLPYLKQLVVEQDVTPYVEYFSNVLMGALEVTNSPTSNESQKKILSEALSENRSCTIFELYERGLKTVPIVYNSDGYPVLPHPRVSSPFMTENFIASFIRQHNEDKSRKQEDIMEIDTQPMESPNTDHHQQQRRHQPLSLRKVPLNLLGMNDLSSDYSLEHVRTLLENEFSLADLQPLFPTATCGGGSWWFCCQCIDKNIKLTLIQAELRRISDVTRTTALDWIARDIIMSASIPSFPQTTETTESPNSPSRKSQLTRRNDLEADIEDEEGYEDVIDPTVQTLLEDRDLNLPKSATIHNPQLLKSPFPLSKEAILLRDKWVNPRNWYEDGYDARRRMGLQVSLQTWSKHQDPLKMEGGANGERSGGTATEPSKKRKSGRATLTQQDLMKAIEDECILTGSQVRVVSASQKMSQSLSNSQNQGPSHRLGGLGSLGSGSVRVDSPKPLSVAATSSMSQSLKTESQLPQRVASPLPSLGSRFSFGGSQLQSGSMSQQTKKKPRKSGF
ncbi:hypothetical protein BDR26DRAFT_849229 [Obelidium mucronatum]|nr:hypothetical protein BDR26DRAFT_849229 [Obelidium mucronatum]